MSINRRAFLGWVGVGGVASSLGMAIAKSDAKQPLATTTSKAPAVTVHEEVLTLPWYTSEPYYKIEHPSLRSFFVVPGTQKRAGERTFKTIVLENQFIRVQVAPEIGGAVARAIYKPTGDDFFFLEGKAKDWRPFWESGVKVGFPFIEHGIGMEQPASYRIVPGADGSVTVAMWMEFSRFNECYNLQQYGRFSNMLLSQHVTLKPSEGFFSITYRIVNPMPYKQGRQLSNDAIFPRNQIAQGALQGDAQPPEMTLTEWIYPAIYVSDHGGKDFRSYSEDDTRIANYRKPHNSIFSWSIPYGFAGLWYPSVNINRLRLFDPQIAPRTKQYFKGEGTYEPGNLYTHMYNFCELWGGTDNLFEGVENWIGPGESFQYTHSYTLISGIGKIDYADRQVAVKVQLSGKPQVQAVTLRPVEKLTAKWNGKLIDQEVPSAPDKPALFQIPGNFKKGRLTLIADGKIILDRQFPLEIPVDTSQHQKIRESVQMDSASGAERFGNARHWGRNYRSAIDGQPAIEGKPASEGKPPIEAQPAIKSYPQGSVDRGRVLYRDGQIDQAIDCLKKSTATNPEDGEGWHLLGAALLEKGEPEAATSAFQNAMRAKNPYPPANYFLALAALAKPNWKGEAEAKQALSALVEAIPQHWEARLLQAWINANRPKRQLSALESAQALATEDPADPRIQFILLHGAQHTGEKELAVAAKEALDQLLKEPGAKARLAEFEAATRGEYKAPLRIQNCK